MLKNLIGIKGMYFKGNNLVKYSSQRGLLSVLILILVKNYYFFFINLGKMFFFAFIFRIICNSRYCVISFSINNNIFSCMRYSKNNDFIILVRKIVSFSSPWNWSYSIIWQINLCLILPTNLKIVCNMYCI